MKPCVPQQDMQKFKYADLWDIDYEIVTLIKHQHNSEKAKDWERQSKGMCKREQDKLEEWTAKRASLCIVEDFSYPFL